MQVALHQQSQRSIQAGIARTLITTVLVMMPAATVLLWLGGETVRAQRALIMLAVELPILLWCLYMLLRLKPRAALVVAWLSFWGVLTLLLLTAGTLNAVPMPTLLALAVAGALSGERLLAWCAFSLSGASLLLVGVLEHQGLLALNVPPSIAGTLLGCLIALMVLALLARNMSQHVLGLYRNSVTSAARLSQLSRRLELALKAGGMCYFRLERRSLRVNLSPTAQTMLGCSVQHLALEDLPGFSAEAQNALRTHAQAMTCTGTSAPFELQLQWPDRHLWARMFLIREQGSDQLICALQDISAEKHMDETKSQFAAMVSHELRTPLTALLGSIRLLDGLYQQQLDEQGQQILNLSLRGGERLAGLVNDILDFEKMQAERLAFDLVVHDLIEQVAQSVETVHSLAQEKRLTVQVGGASQARAQLDAGRAQQVLLNLLSNAIKFSPEGGIVTVSISAHPPFWRVAVSDQGTGVPADFQDKLFQPFSQAHSDNTRETKSTGLGLAISFGLMQRMGGALWCESPPDSGATFYADFVAAAQSEEHSA
ncbi:sensor histidine kinase [Atopomonas sediminilitoris]|uniref:sensor histidine kinase n=1 Tax=Atopomonas sediminilitoris TaxID=2919919 RepID=UPI001F4E2981|nr:HAMP domain-containing sensor histidine kinase [Atopomonas sediminilitoris]MCJ8168419.1 HAMP domain-containing histidine kinase [Atopomonas sediminilitoris]